MVMNSSDSIEREIIARAQAAKLRLRFDKVAVRVVERLKAALAGDVPEGHAVIFTISAPIGLPGRTALALENLIRSAPPVTERRETIHDNDVQIRWLSGVPQQRPRAMGFVHSAASDAVMILDLAEARLVAPDAEP